MRGGVAPPGAYTPITPSHGIEIPKVTITIPVVALYDSSVGGNARTCIPGTKLLFETAVGHVDAGNSEVMVSAGSEVLHSQIAPTN